MRPAGYPIATVLVLVSGCAALPSSTQQAATSNGWLESAATGMKYIWRDHLHYYSPPAINRMALGIALAAPLANTSADGDLRAWYQDRLRSSVTDDIADVTQVVGEYFYALPVFAGAALIGGAGRDTTAGAIIFDWGQRSLRSMAVGIPPLLFWQHALGASRPNEADSNWRPFQDNNAASGHAFTGAIPFLAAASMTDEWYWRCLWIAASLAPGWARLNNDDHYFSQVALGWCLAHLAVSSVSATERSPRPLTWSPAVFPDGAGINFLLDF